MAHKKSLDPMTSLPVNMTSGMTKKMKTINPLYPHTATIPLIAQIEGIVLFVCYGSYNILRPLQVMESSCAFTGSESSKTLKS